MLQAIRLRENAREIDPSRDLATFGIDAGNAIRLPYIGENLTLDILKLVEITNRPRAIGHFDTSNFSKCIGIPKINNIRAIAHNQFCAIVSKPPTLRSISKLGL